MLTLGGGRSWQTRWRRSIPIVQKCIPYLSMACLRPFSLWRSSKDITFEISTVKMVKFSTLLRFLAFMVGTTEGAAMRGLCSIFTSVELRTHMFLYRLPLGSNPHMYAVIPQFVP